MKLEMKKEGLQQTMQKYKGLYFGLHPFPWSLQAGLTLWEWLAVHGGAGRGQAWISCSLLLGIFPTRGLNAGLLPCWWILYQLIHKRSPRILEWVAYLFSRESSWPRNSTGVSCIPGRFFTSWATREAQIGCPHKSMDVHKQQFSLIAKK